MSPDIDLKKTTGLTISDSDQVFFDVKIKNELITYTKDVRAVG